MCDCVCVQIHGQGAVFDIPADSTVRERDHKVDGIVDSSREEDNTCCSVRSRITQTQRRCENESL